MRTGPFGAAWRRRRMMRRLRELDRLDAEHGLGAPLALRRPRSGRRVADWLPLLATPAVLLALVVAAPGLVPAEVRRFVGLGPDRLSPAVEAPARGRHAFLHQQQGSRDPVTWDPCRPIRYRINPAGGPEDAVGLVREAVAITAAATGLDFSYEGLTDERPDWARPFIPSSRSARRPALISWATAEEVDELAGDVAGVGGAVEVGDDQGRAQLRGGGVTLDIDAFHTMATQPQGRTRQRAVILHELGHLVGLGHVEDDAELMSPRSGSRLDYGPGDLEGLAILGRGPCR